MFDKLKLTEKRYEEVNEKLMDPNVVNDTAMYRDLMKEFKTLTPIIEKYREYLGQKKTFDESKELLDGGGLDKDFREMVQEEYDSSKEAIATLTEELKILLLPKDPNDDRNVIIEIRGGVGGEEAALFAHSLFRMYSMYAE
ncbi:MAG: PCRF domain-containing protein, partial [Oscillospiraceae bacterium]